MQSPSLETVRSFNRQLKAINSQLRCIWGEPDYGICRWVVQRELPADIHGKCLEEFGELFPGEHRFINQKMTNDEGKVIGERRVDQVNPWVLVHVVADKFYDLDDERGYCVPRETDISAIWNWLHEFKNISEQMRAFKNAEQKRDEKNQADRVRCLAEDISTSRSVWEDPEPIYVGKSL